MARQRDSFSPSALKGFLMLVGAGVFAYVVAWLIVFGGAATTTEQFAPQQLSFAPINETHEFLSYTHPDYNFTVLYPVGFLAEELDGEIASFRAHAGVAGRIPEVYEVIVDNSTSADSAYGNALQDARESGETSTRSLHTENGRTARVIEVTLPASSTSSSDEIQPEEATMLTAFYQCSNYAATVIAIVPSSLTGDIGIAEYILKTFKC